MVIEQGVREIDAVDTAALPCDLFAHPGMDLVEVRDAHHPFTDAPLIGDDHDTAEYRGTVAQGFRNAFIKGELPVMQDIAVLLLDIDDPVTVEKECPGGVYLAEVDHFVRVMMVWQARQWYPRDDARNIFLFPF